MSREGKAIVGLSAVTDTDQRNVHGGAVATNTDKADTMNQGSLRHPNTFNLKRIRLLYICAFQYQSKAMDSGKI